LKRKSLPPPEPFSHVSYVKRCTTQMVRGPLGNGDPLMPLCARIFPNFLIRDDFQRNTNVPGRGCESHPCSAARGIKPATRLPTVRDVAWEVDESDFRSHPGESLDAEPEHVSIRFGNSKFQVVFPPSYGLGGWLGDSFGCWGFVLYRLLTGPAPACHRTLSAVRPGHKIFRHPLHHPTVGHSLHGVVEGSRILNRCWVSWSKWRGD